MSNLRKKMHEPIPIPIKKITLPEFGCDVFCHGMTARDKTRHEAGLMKKDWSGIDREKALSQKERIVAWCLRDDQGARVFSNEDIKLLGQWPASLLNRVYDVCNELCGGDTDDVDEDAVKKLQETSDE